MLFSCYVWLVLGIMYIQKMKKMKKIQHIGQVMGPSKKVKQIAEEFWLLIKAGVDLVLRICVEFLLQKDLD